MSNVIDIVPHLSKEATLRVSEGIVTIPSVYSIKMYIKDGELAEFDTSNRKMMDTLKGNAALMEHLLTALITLTEGRAQTLSEIINILSEVRSKVNVK